MTKVVVSQRVDGSDKNTINLDGLEDFVRKTEGGVIRCTVCQKPVKEGEFFMGSFHSGHEKCVEKADEKIFDEIMEDWNEDEEDEDDEEENEDDQEDEF